MEEEKFFDSHSAFNRYQTMYGMRICESGTEPSAYITEVKLKKAFKRISDEDIENLFEKEMSRVAVQKHREKLDKKLGTLQKWQKITALNIYIGEEDIEKSAKYVLRCKNSNKKSEE